MVSKVMTAHWVYSDKLEEKRTKIEEQRIDLKAAEKKEQFNGKASATFTAHVREGEMTPVPTSLQSTNSNLCVCVSNGWACLRQEPFNG